MTNTLNTSVIKRTIRVKSSDSAFVYALLESYEGWASYSTLNHKPGEAHRDLELWVPAAYIDNINELLIDLGDLIYDLDRSGT